MSPNPTLTTEVVTRLIAENLSALRAEIRDLQNRVTSLTGADSVVEYQTQNIDETIGCDESLDVVKSLPEFNGKANTYVSWREASQNCMSLYTKGSRRYFAALTILRNKITSYANDVLTNHGTVLNYDAIISRLDFAFSDKRPIHIIEQEMSILRQGSMSVIDYYNLVNRKLTLLINKTIMTHGNDKDITNELNNKNRQTALRVFITGLQPPLSDILFSLSPTDLPNALAKAQELESNNIRANFADSYYKNLRSNNPSQNSKQKQNNSNTLKFEKKSDKIQHPPGDEPMDIDSSNQHTQRNERKFHNRNYDFGRGNRQNQNYQNKPKNYEVNGAIKHSHPTDSYVNTQPQPKTQRINNIDETHFLEENSDSHSCTDGTEQ